MKYRDCRGRKFRLAKDVTFPAGTEIGVAAQHVGRIVPFAEGLLAVTKDSTAEFTMPLDEAIAMGLVEEV